MTRRAAWCSRIVLTTLVLAVMASVRTAANGPMPIFLGAPPYYSPRPDPEALVVYEGEPIPFKVVVVGDRERSLPIYTAGSEAFFVLAIADVAGRQPVSLCATWHRIDVGVGKQIKRVDPESGAFEIPAGGTMEAFVSFTPCGGTLAAGEYFLWLGSASRALVLENERPSVFDRKAIEYRSATTTLDQLDKLCSRVAALMMMERWAEAARAVDAAIDEYPTCAMLQHYKAVIAEERDDLNAAVAATQRALTLIERREDTWLLSARGERDAADQARAMRKDLDRLRAGITRKPGK